MSDIIRLAVKHDRVLLPRPLFIVIDLRPEPWTDLSVCLRAAVLKGDSGKSTPGLHHAGKSLCPNRRLCSILRFHPRLIERLLVVPHNSNLKAARARMHRVIGNLHHIRYEEADAAAAHRITKLHLPFSNILGMLAIRSLRGALCGGRIKLMRTYRVASLNTCATFVLCRF